LPNYQTDFSISYLRADAGYDSEAVHAHAREELGIRTTIPPTASQNQNICLKKSIANSWLLYLTTPHTNSDGKLRLSSQ
jgi:hypothetical protein